MAEFKLKKGQKIYHIREFSSVMELARRGLIAPDDAIFVPAVGRWVYARAIQELRPILPSPDHLSDDAFELPLEFVEPLTEDIGGLTVEMDVESMGIGVSAVERRLEPIASGRARDVMTRPGSSPGIPVRPASSPSIQVRPASSPSIQVRPGSSPGVHVPGAEGDDDWEDQPTQVGPPPRMATPTAALFDPARTTGRTTAPRPDPLWGPEPSRRPDPRGGSGEAPAGPGSARGGLTAADYARGVLQEVPTDTGRGQRTTSEQGRGGGMTAADYARGGGIGAADYARGVMQEAPTDSGRGGMTAADYARGGGMTAADYARGGSSTADYPHGGGPGAVDYARGGGSSAADYARVGANPADYARGGGASTADYARGGGASAADYARGGGPSAADYARGGTNAADYARGGGATAADYARGAPAVPGEYPGDGPSGRRQSGPDRQSLPPDFVRNPGSGRDTGAPREFEPEGRRSGVEGVALRRSGALTGPAMNSWMNGSNRRPLNGVDPGDPDLWEDRAAGSSASSHRQGSGRVASPVSFQDWMEERARKDGRAGAADVAPLIPTLIEPGPGPATEPPKRRLSWVRVAIFSGVALVVFGIFTFWVRSTANMEFEKLEPRTVPSVAVEPAIPEPEVQAAEIDPGADPKAGGDRTAEPSRPMVNAGDEARLRELIKPQTSAMRTFDQAQDELFGELLNLRVAVADVKLEPVQGDRAKSVRTTEADLTVRVKEGKFTADQQAGLVGLVTGKYIKRNKMVLRFLVLEIDRPDGDPLIRRVTGETAGEFFSRSQDFQQFLLAMQSGTEVPG